jgi:hypothetical protein
MKPESIDERIVPVALVEAPKREGGQSRIQHQTARVVGTHRLLPILPALPTALRALEHASDANHQPLACGLDRPLRCSQLLEPPPGARAVEGKPASGNLPGGAALAGPSSRAVRSAVRRARGPEGTRGSATSSRSEGLTTILSSPSQHAAALVPRRRAELTRSCPRWRSGSRRRARPGGPAVRRLAGAGPTRSGARSTRAA